MSLALGRSFSKAVLTHGDDRSCLQVFGMVRKSLKAHQSLLSRTYTCHSDDSAVRLPMQHRQGTKIFVQCDENSLLSVGTPKDGFISWV